MVKGLGFGISYQNSNSFPRPFVINNRPRGTLFYDSIGNQFRTQTALAVAPDGFNEYMKAYFDPSTAGGLQDMSTDGAALFKSIDAIYHMIDDSAGEDPSTWTRGSYYNSNFSGLSTPANTSDYAIIVSGTNDATVGSSVTKAKHKLGFAKLKEFIQADFPFIQCAFLMPLHRSDYALSVDANYNIVRQANLEKCEEDTWFKRLPDTYDLDLADTAHFTNTVYQTTFGKRFSDCVAYVFGKRSGVGIYGPRVTDARFYGGYVDYTIEHDAGTDISVTSGCENTIALTLGSSDFKHSSVERIDATTIRGHFDNKQLNSSAVGYATIVHGCMKELSQTSAEVVKDNASGDNKPLRSSIIMPSIEHPLFRVTNADLHLVAKIGAKTYASGALVSSIIDRCGKTWSSAAGDEATYDATLFNNKGGLRATDGNRFLQSPNASWTASDNIWMVFVLQPGAATQTNKYIATVEGSTACALYTNASGQINYQTASPNNISTQDLRATAHFLMVNKQGANVSFYLDSASLTHSVTNASATTALDRLTLFNRTSAETGGNVDMAIAEVLVRGSAYNPATDPSIAEILAFCKSYYGTV